MEIKRILDQDKQASCVELTQYKDQLPASVIITTNFQVYKEYVYPNQ
jgi:hypothetical protein